MSHTDGSLARRLDFGEITTTVGCSRQLKADLRLAGRRDRLPGPDKYRALDHRRRQAQIKARRLLDLL
jgi:hypothetical protein